jgi:triosephosphate isomerase
LDGATDGLSSEAVAELVVAYEPVWAIGTGETATPDDAQEVCAALRTRISERFGDECAATVRILYGGSMKPANAPALMARPDIDGGLVGGASLVAEDFARLVRYRDEIVV